MNNFKKTINKNSSAITNLPGPYYNLSYAQERLYKKYKADPLDTHSNKIYIQELKGDLDARLLNKTLQTLIERHELLRTNFIELDGLPKQVIHPLVKVSLKTIDLSNLIKSDKETQINKIIRKEAERPFKLEKGNLFRFTLIKKSFDNYIFIPVMHHIIEDKMTMIIFWKELSLVYDAYLNNRANPLLPLSLQYRDYAKWDRSPAHIKKMIENETYWLQKLSGHLPILDLPIDKPHKLNQGFNCTTEKIKIDTKTTKKIKKVCQDNGVTMFMLLFSAYNVFLFYLTNQSEIIVGTPATIRMDHWFKNIIGPIYTTLPIKTSLKNDLKFIDLLKQTKYSIIEALAYTDIRIDILKEKINKNRTSNKQIDLFQLMFQYYHKEGERIDLPYLRSEPRRIFPKDIHHALHLFIGEEINSLDITFCYNINLFYKKSIKSYLKTFKSLLQLISKESNITISKIKKLTSK